MRITFPVRCPHADDSRRYFRDIDDTEGGSDFIATLAKQLTIRAFISHERLPIGQMYILRKGFVVKMCGGRASHPTPAGRGCRIPLVPSSSLAQLSASSALTRPPHR